MPSTRLTIMSVVVAFAALVLVFELLRRRRLREKYAAIWVIISFGTFVVAVFPQLLSGIADLVGIETPSNLLFFVSLIVLFAVSLQLSGEVGLLEEQSRRLAEEVGTLRLRFDAIENGRPQADGDPPAPSSTSRASSERPPDDRIVPKDPRAH